MNLGLGLQFAGAAANGVVEGRKDYRDQQKADFDELQRKKMLKDQQLDDQLAAAYRTARPAGTYTDKVEDPNGGYQDMGDQAGPPAAKVYKSVTTKVSAQDHMRKLAELAETVGGRPQDVTGAAQLRSLANQQDMIDHQNHARDVYLNMAKVDQIAAVSPVAAAHHLSKLYESINDGHKLVVESDGRGGSVFGIMGPDAKWIDAPKPVTAENVKEMTDRGRMLAAPEAYSSIRGMNTADVKAAAETMHGTAATTNANTGIRRAVVDERAQGNKDDMLPYEKALKGSEQRKNDWGSIGPGGQARIDLEGKQGNYYDAHGQYQLGRMGAEKHGPVMTMQDAQGNPVVMAQDYSSPGGPRMVQMGLPDGVKSVKPMPTLNDQQKGALDVYHKSLISDPPRNEAEKDKRISDLGLTSVVPLSPLAQKMLAADPKNKDTPKQGITPPTADTPAAAPAEQKYSRTKGRGGAWMYSAGGGRAALTKAQWAKIDADAATKGH